MNGDDFNGFWHSTTHSKKKFPFSAIRSGPAIYQKETFVRLEKPYSNHGVVINAHYPHLSYEDSLDNTALTEINAFLKSNFIDFYYENGQYLVPSESDSAGWSSSSWYIVQYIDSNIISLHKGSRHYPGTITYNIAPAMRVLGDSESGIHDSIFEAPVPHETYHGDKFTVDIRTARRFAIGDCFSLDALDELDKLIIKELHHSCSQEDQEWELSEYQRECIYPQATLTDFSLSRRGIEFHFDDCLGHAYLACSFADIPFKKLNHLLLRTGALGKFRQ